MHRSMEIMEHDRDDAKHKRVDAEHEYRVMRDEDLTSKTILYESDTELVLDVFTATFGGGPFLGMANTMITSR